MPFVHTNPVPGSGSPASPPNQAKFSSQSDKRARPAAGLDDHEAAEMAELIRRLAHESGIGVLLVEHKIDMVMSISDRVSVLVGGSILTSGSPEEVRSDPGVLDAYLGRASASPSEAEPSLSPSSASVAVQAHR
jgi:ABC-type multidrug transport system ATPase subunit